MANQSTTYLDLDSVEADIDFTVKLNGKDHKVKESSVSDFLANVRAIESLAVGASVEKEYEVIIGIIQRALPTVSAQELQGLRLTQLHKIRDYVMTANGEKAEEAAPGEGAAEGKPGKAPKAS
ncbi:MULTISPECIES: hypothetical protein [unclassified Ensifer]|uniref:hypothetical protein n=1 Tax=unclassified Ensifer TaxID=2633371 RepID=UPI000813B95F|nr:MULTISPECIES: hypothetical protein [unclassified Ensifer]OCP21897.1 hypothetical protein BC361_25345 [Ensifer sp. LC54]OCP23323.1 hypothetical protein BC363_25420 [Ensifer sp. LC384]